MKKNKMGTGKKVILAVCIIVFLVSLSFLAKDLLDISGNKNEYESISELVEEPSDETSAPDFSEVIAKNSDFVGWLKVPNTSINHPVVQTDDNDYYLNRNFDKEVDRRGAIYMDYRNNPVDLDANTIIYGHNCYDTTMFSQLTEYEDIEFYKKTPVFEYSTTERTYKFKIYAVFITNAKESEDNGYVFYYNTPDIDTNNFEGFIEEVNKRRLYVTDVDINENDKIMILSTCVRALDLYDRLGRTTYRADARIAILARAVRDGESETVNTEKAYVNENPKYPQLWYDKHGLDNPYKNDKGWSPGEAE